MNHDLFMCMTVIGAIIGALLLVIAWWPDEGFRVTEPMRLAVFTLLCLTAWLWLPWLVYPLTLVPWSKVEVIMAPHQPAEPRVTTFNPNGVPAKIEVEKQP